MTRTGSTARARGELCHLASDCMLALAPAHSSKCIAAWHSLLSDCVPISAHMPAFLQRKDIREHVQQQQQMQTSLPSSMVTSLSQDSCQ